MSNLRLVDSRHFTQKSRCSVRIQHIINHWRHFRVVSLTMRTNLIITISIYLTMVNVQTALKSPSPDILL